jgi:hypothetical protein
MSSATRSSCWLAAGRTDPATSAGSERDLNAATDPGEDPHGALINLDIGFLQ